MSYELALEKAKEKISLLGLKGTEATFNGDQKWDYIPQEEVKRIMPILKEFDITVKQETSSKYDTDAQANVVKCITRIYHNNQLVEEYEYEMGVQRNANLTSSQSLIADISMLKRSMLIHIFDLEIKKDGESAASAPEKKKLMGPAIAKAKKDLSNGTTSLDDLKKEYIISSKTLKDLEKYVV